MRGDRPLRLQAMEAASVDGVRRLSEEEMTDWSGPHSAPETSSPKESPLIARSLKAEYTSSKSPEPTGSHEPYSGRLTMALALVVTLGSFAVMAGILFASAGRWDLPMFWVYLAVMIVPSMLSLLLLYQRSPDLIKERLRPGPGEQDRLTVGVLLLTLATHWGIAGLDVGRFHWSGVMPLAVQLAGLLGYAVGIGLLVWATLVNRFFSSAVRIQTDRGQYVVTTGPYQYVRHPGYSGGILFFLCSGLALGSWWSILPILLAVAAVIRRTRLEDRMLQEGLRGYRDYAQHVRYRLVPGLW